MGGQNDRFASATVFVLSFATKGLPSEVDWSESCFNRVKFGLRPARAGEFMETLPQESEVPFRLMAWGPGFTAVAGIPLALGMARTVALVQAGGHEQ